MGDSYEKRYGIWNHGNREIKRPLSSVAMFPSENFTERGLYYDTIMEFSDNNYREIFGFTLEEFLNLPQWKVRMIREITQEIIAKKSTALNGAAAAAGISLK